MIELAHYLMGRDREFGHLFGSDLRKNALVTVEAANKMLVLAKAVGVSLESNPRTGSIVSSGWRPASVNEATPGAAVRSKHIRCEAIDLYDPDGELDEWAMAAADVALRDLGLWLEHPSATKGWCHVQTVPPRSGRRVFYP